MATKIENIPLELKKTWLKQAFPGLTIEKRELDGGKITEEKQWLAKVPGVIMRKTGSNSSWSTSNPVAATGRSEDESMNKLFDHVAHAITASSFFTDFKYEATRSGGSIRGTSPSGGYSVPSYSDGDYISLPKLPEAQ